MKICHQQKKTESNDEQDEDEDEDDEPKIKKNNFKYQKQEVKTTKIEDDKKVYKRRVQEKKDDMESMSQSQSQTIEEKDNTISVSEEKAEQPVVKRYHRRYREARTSTPAYAENKNSNSKNNNYTSSTSTVVKNGNTTTFTSNTVYSRHRKK